MKHTTLIVTSSTFKNAGQEEESSDNPYLQLGTVEPVDLVKFSYQIASGMVRLEFTIMHSQTLQYNVAYHPNSC